MCPKADFYNSPTGVWLVTSLSLLQIKPIILHCQCHLLRLHDQIQRSHCSHGFNLPLFFVFLLSCYCVSALERAIMSVLCPGLGDRHHIHLVFPVFVPAIMSNLCPRSWCPSSCLACVPCLNARHHFSLLSSVLVPAIMSTLCLCLSARHHVYLVSPSLCPPSFQSLSLVIFILCLPVFVPTIMST